MRKKCYKRQEFKKWGKLGGRPTKYVSVAERQKKAYRRRKALTKLANGERIGILNMTTGRINKHRKSKKNDICKSNIFTEK